MFKRVIASLSVGAVLCLGTESGVAHHSVLINFDRQAVTEVRGTVSAVYLRNPHSQYVLDVTEDDGSVNEWFIEWADRNALTRRGVNLDLIQVGDEVTITIWPSHRLENVGYFRSAILADGTVFSDCGFVAFRQAVANSTEYVCDLARGAK